MKPIQMIAATISAAALAACGSANPDAQADTGARTEETRAVIEALYDGFKTGDGAKVQNAMAADIEWNEAEGNPYADGNPYVGLPAISAGVFARLRGEWIDWTTTPAEIVVEGDRAVVFGRYTATNKATGKPLDAPFVHSYRVVDGKAVSFQQYTNTAAGVAAMTP